VQTEIKKTKRLESITERRRGRVVIDAVTYPESIAGVVGIDVAVDGDGDVYTYTDTYIYINMAERVAGGWRVARVSRVAYQPDRSRAPTNRRSV
jgi:hypothetical protein